MFLQRCHYAPNASVLLMDFACVFIWDICLLTMDVLAWPWNQTNTGLINCIWRCSFGLKLWKSSRRTSNSSLMSDRLQQHCVSWGVHCWEFLIPDSVSLLVTDIVKISFNSSFKSYAYKNLFKSRLSELLAYNYLR